MNPELKVYLARKGWQNKSRGENVYVKICPFCNDARYKFNIHKERGVYSCYHCKATGNLFKLKRELGDLDAVRSAAHGDTSKGKPSSPVPMPRVLKMHKRLMKDSKAAKRARRWLTEQRGLTLPTIQHFQLGLYKKSDCYWIAMPHIVNGVCWNVKYRSVPPAEKDFRRINGKKSVLFNCDALADFEDLVIVESEIDCMSLWQAGIKNVVGLTCGADTFAPDWYDLLHGKERFTICLDADTAGQQGARNIARRLGFDRTYNVLLQGYHDPNDVLTEAGPDAIAQQLTHAEQFEVEGVITASEAMALARNTAEDPDAGILTPWQGVNRFLPSGFLPGDLITLSAKVKVGKTSFALNEGFFAAERLQVPTLFWCLEMRPERLARKLAQMVRQVEDESLGILDFLLSHHRVKNVPFWFGEPQWSNLDVDVVVDSIRDAVRRYGVKLLVFDNLHFLVRSTRNQAQEVGKVSRAFKMLAEEMELAVMLISQPRKVQGKRNKIIGFEDIKDSSSVPADSDYVILLHRDRVDVGGETASETDEVLSPETLVIFDAARFGSGGVTKLHFDGALSTFRTQGDVDDMRWLLGQRGDRLQPDERIARILRKVQYSRYMRRVDRSQPRVLTYAEAATGLDTEELIDLADEAAEAYDGFGEGLTVGGIDFS